MSDPRTRIAPLLLAMASALFTWWRWKQGAYFGGVFYPGALFVFGLLAMLLVLAPFEARLARAAAGVAMFSLLAIGGWTLLSGLWSQVPAVALRDGEDAFLYAAVFAAGLWTAHLLRARMQAALLGPALAGAAVGGATVFVLATGSDFGWYLHGDATLAFPIGYRNANAAFFLICFWPVLALAAESDWRWQARAPLVALGTVLVELAFLAQSRGSVPGAIVAAFIYLALARDRLRAAACMALVALPAAIAAPTLLEVYRHGNADPQVVPLLHDAARAIVLSGAFSLVLASVALGAAGPRLGISRRTRDSIFRIGALIALLVLAVGSISFVARHGGPLGFVDQRLEEFTQEGSPDLHSQGIRYGINVGSNRYDFWRVAVDQGLERPLTGGGAGSFQIAYLKHRESGESPHDPHSIEALFLSELGFPGLLMLIAFLVAAALAGLRSRRLGPRAATLTAGALAAAGQWLTQASFDWLWHYPGVTAPAIFLLGAAAAPALLDPTARRRRGRSVAIAGLAALALLAVPLFLSGRYAQRASDLTAGDPRTAIEDLDRAADLNPFDAEPLLAKGVIESRLGDGGAALASFREGAQREPENYAAYYFMAVLQQRSDPPAAARALAKAERLDPKDPGVVALRRRLSRASSG